jgi:hypothetical protein
VKSLVKKVFCKTTWELSKIECCGGQIAPKKRLPLFVACCRKGLRAGPVIITVATVIISDIRNHNHCRVPTFDGTMVQVPCIGGLLATSRILWEMYWFLHKVFNATYMVCPPFFGVVIIDEFAHPSLMQQLELSYHFII